MLMSFASYVTKNTRILHYTYQSVNPYPVNVENMVSS